MLHLIMSRAKIGSFHPQESTRSKMAKAHRCRYSHQVVPVLQHVVRTGNVTQAQVSVPVSLATGVLTAQAPVREEETTFVAATDIVSMAAPETVNVFATLGGRHASHLLVFVMSI